MTEPLLTISAFARAVDLAPGTLRYYDEAGLLPPAEVDPQTGYRYYTPALERRAHMIRRMREVGVPVDTMRLVLDSPPEKAAEVLHEFAARSAEEARRTEEAVADVVAALRREEAAPAKVEVGVDGPELAAALDRVALAASTEEGSPLATVLLEIGADGLAVVATDRYWMAVWRLPAPSAGVAERRVVLPAAEVERVSGWLRRRETAVLTAADEVVLAADDGDLVVPTQEDRFPAYRAIVEAQVAATGWATLAREDLLRALDVHAEVVRFSVGRDRVTVSPQDGPEGVRVDAVTFGAPVTIGFPPSRLALVLEAAVGSQVTLRYAAPDRPVQVSSPEQRSLLMLAMPCRLEG